jgi:hypothetical protein
MLSVQEVKGFFTNIAIGHFWICPLRSLSLLDCFSPLLIEMVYIANEFEFSLFILNWKILTFLASSHSNLKQVV